MKDYPKDRNDLPLWLNTHNLIGEGIEIGVLSGTYSRVILNTWKGKRLYLVDPWCKQDVNVYKEDDGRFNHDEDYRQCIELQKIDNRVILVKKLSKDASAFIRDDQLDFAYIDANHSYESVTEDMDLWFQKVRPGGILGGHDFYNNTEYPYWNEVQRAVENWCALHKKEYATSPCTSWWILK